MTYFSLLTLFSFLLCFNIQASDLDVEGLKLEEGKKALTVFNLDPYIAMVDAMNSYDADDFDDESLPKPPVKYASMEAIQAFMEECRNRRTEADKERARQENEKIRKIEKEIVLKILGFKKKYPQFDEIISTTCAENHTQNLGDITKKIGDSFQKSRNIEEADYFYDLASNFNYLVDGSCSGDYSAALSQGYMHLDLYNQEIAETKTRNPTVSMFYHLKQAISGLSSPSPDEVADFVSTDLIKIQNMIVRWYLYPSTLKADTYYGHSNDLVRRVYAYGFVQRMLQQAETLKVLKNNAKRYDGSMTNADLAKYLKNLGFCGVFQTPSQHNWVHSNGFMIRVKRIEDWKAQFTIGLTFNNPIIWNADGTPDSLKRHSDGYPLVFDEDNEIIKIAYDGRAIFVIPASRSKDWLPYWFNRGQIDAMMKLAHLPLESFGKKKHAHSDDTKDLEKLLSF